jgi:hypothetical protein
MLNPIYPAARKFMFIPDLYSRFTPTLKKLITQTLTTPPFHAPIFLLYPAVVTAVLALNTRDVFGRRWRSFGGSECYGVLFG